jgi:hypothetical protein
MSHKAHGVSLWPTVPEPVEGSEAKLIHYRRAKEPSASISFEERF